MFSCQQEPPIPPQELTIIEMDPENAAVMAKEIRNTVPAEVGEGLELTLWATDSLVADPIAMRMDEMGRAFYTRAIRQKNSEFDIRGHMAWTTESISWETVEDRRAFLKKEFAPERSAINNWLKDLNEDGIHDWKDLAIEKEQTYFVEDRSGDGVADFAQLFSEDFNDEVTDVTNGVLPFDGSVYLTVAPDVWRLKDRNGDGMADEKTSISHGFGVHVGFSGHGMSGIIMGPDGKLYWSIGDIGMNVTDQTGKQWKYPNQGVVVRANPDGSDFEVFAAGLRNTHEFVFDEYGNIFSEDNDGDHPKERERLVYITYGSDAGWRTNWQFGKYTDPDNNKYKVWMDEGLHLPRHEQTPAYIIPPIINYHNGPTGMVYNPGTALGPEWKNHFFLVEFVGSPSNATINAFTLKPEGAGFQFNDERRVLKGVLATGMDFGPDGALYFSDWITGWGTNDRGRIWKLDVPNGAQSEIRQSTKSILQSDFKATEIAVLKDYLTHPDMRVRMKSQFELVKRGRRGKKIFEEQLAQKEHQLARVHSIWGLGQLGREKEKDLTPILTYLNDEDPEIIAQVLKVIGDNRYAKNGEAMVSLLQHASSRVQFFAAQALGRIAFKPAIDPLIEMIRTNDDQDLYLRHAGINALAMIGETAPIVALKDDASKAVRIAAVVILRRMQDPGVAEFLDDNDAYIVTEAARAINDDWSIKEALPELAHILNSTPFQNEALIRRVINANLRVGKEENLELVTNYALREDVPEKMRAEAIAVIGTWAKPSLLDRVDGRYRGLKERPIELPQKVLANHIDNLLQTTTLAIKAAAVEAAGRLKITSIADHAYTLVMEAKEPSLRLAGLNALVGLNDERLVTALKNALNDKDKSVRIRGIALVPKMDLPETEFSTLYNEILSRGTVKEQQTAINALKEQEGARVTQLLNDLLTQWENGNLEPGVQIELEEVISVKSDSSLKNRLDQYLAGLSEKPALDQYMAALDGGDWWRGKEIFESHEAAQCTRCHVVEGEGSDVGPALTGVSARLNRKELLESLVDPSAQLATGYAIESIRLKDGKTIAGYLLMEDNAQLVLKLGDQEQIISKDLIETRETAPSGMPAMGYILNKKQIRDVVAYLSNL